MDGCSRAISNKDRQRAAKGCKGVSVTRLRDKDIEESRSRVTAGGLMDHYQEITDYERGKRFILANASLQFDRASRDGRTVALWAIWGHVWIESDFPGMYRLHRTSVSVYNYLSLQ